MPSTSAKQAKLMRAVAHGWKKPGGGGPSQSVAKEFAAADKKKGKFGMGGKSNAPKINNPNPRHGKLDLPVSPVGRFMKLKGRKKYAEGGWSTSLSFDEADAKRRAEEWAKSHPKKEAKKAAPKKAAAKPAPKKSSSKDDYGSGMADFKAGFRETLKDKPRAAGPKPGSSEYVDRQVADSRAEKAAVEKGKKSAFAGAQMVEPDAPKKAREAYIYQPAAAIATMPLAEGAMAARAARAADARGFIGKEATAALESLRKRGQLARNVDKWKATRPISEVVKEAQKRGAGWKSGGSVKKYARGGGVEIRGKTRGRII